MKASGSLENLWKRKREESGERGQLEDNGEERIFKRSKKTARSPKAENEIEKGWEEAMTELMREEMGRFLREIKGGLV